MSKFKEDDGVRFVLLRNGMSNWLNGRIGVVSKVHDVYGEVSYHIVDSGGTLLLGFEDELEAYP